MLQGAGISQGAGGGARSNEFWSRCWALSRLEVWIGKVLLGVPCAVCRVLFAVLLLQLAVNRRASDGTGLPISKGWTRLNSW